VSLALKVIVAEDNRFQRAVLSRMVENLGCDVIQAEDGQDAMDRLCETQAQIILSDYQMPKLNGIELTRLVRGLPSDRHVHIIMITAQEDEGIRAEALKSGVDDFLPKNLNPLMLQTRILSASKMLQHAEALAESNRKLRETHELLEQDLQSAADAQRQLLPDLQDSILGFHVFTKFVPSSFVSGDMFGCFPLSDHALGFYAVDVSGHGVHASLSSVAIGHLITPEFFVTKVLANPDRPDPAALVSDLNDRFNRMANDDYFTMFCAVIDSRSGSLAYCQAAYPSPLYVTPGGDVEFVGDGGFPVGMLPQVDYDNRTMEFQRGGSLVICSDAVPEAENEAGVPFGTGRLQGIVAKAPQLGVAELPDAIVRELDGWRAGRALEDDLTIVALERTGPHD